jgi:hypothetical protein
MGSITDLGHLPAFSFNIRADDVLLWGNAYVTPIPEHIKGQEFEKAVNEKNWNLLKRTMLSMFGE